MENFSEPQQQETSVEITRLSLTYLESTRKWTLFLSIVGFIFIGLLLLMGLVMIGTFSMISAFYPIPGFAVFIIYLIFAAVYFFPILYLYKFSFKMRMAIEQKNSQYAEEAFRYQKMMYKFLGILTIVILCIYPFVIFAGIFSAFHHF